MAQRGGKREGAGRKPKVDEQKLVEQLTPIEPSAFKALKDNVDAGEAWAVKLFFEYMYGKPRQQMDITTQGEKMQNIINLGSGKPPKK